MRYLVSKDGARIVEKRRLHLTVLPFSAPAEGESPVATTHTAVLRDVPEDTDVFLVVSKKPPLPHYVIMKRFLYRIDVDGSITFLGNPSRLDDLMKPPSSPPEKPAADPLPGSGDGTPAPIR